MSLGKAVAGVLERFPRFADPVTPRARAIEDLRSAYAAELVADDVIAELLRFGTHKPHCSTVRIEGHKICDCGWVYWQRRAQEAMA